MKKTIQHYFSPFKYNIENLQMKKLFQILYSMEMSCLTSSGFECVHSSLFTVKIGVSVILLILQVSRSYSFMFTIITL